MDSYWTMAGVIFMINMPFGFWRAGMKKFSVSWFAAIHIPVVLAICIRIFAGVPLTLSMLPLFAAVFFFGQALGGMLRASRRT